MTTNKNLDLQTLLKDLQTKDQQLSEAEKKYRAKRAAWAQNKAIRALISLHRSDYDDLYKQGLALYDEQNGSSK